MGGIDGRSGMAAAVAASASDLAARNAAMMRADSVSGSSGSHASAVMSSLSMSPAPVRAMVTTPPPAEAVKVFSASSAWARARSSCSCWACCMRALMSKSPNMVRLLLGGLGQA